jgi:hypothetical protein
MIAKRPEIDHAKSKCSALDRDLVGQASACLGLIWQI